MANRIRPLPRDFKRLSPLQVDRGVAYLVHDRTICAYERSPRNGGRSLGGESVRYNGRLPTPSEGHSPMRWDF